MILHQEKRNSCIAKKKYKNLLNACALLGPVVTFFLAAVMQPPCCDWLLLASKSSPNSLTCQALWGPAAMPVARCESSGICKKAETDFQHICGSRCGRTRTPSPFYDTLDEGSGCCALRQDVLACAAKLLCCFVPNQSCSEMVNTLSQA